MTTTTQQYTDIREKTKYELIEQLHDFKENEVVNSELFLVYEDHALDELVNYLKTDGLITDIDTGLNAYVVGKAWLNYYKIDNKLLVKDRKRRNEIIKAEGNIENEGNKSLWLSIFKEALISTMLEIRRNTIMKVEKPDEYYEKFLRKHIAERLLELSVHKMAGFISNLEQRIWQSDGRYWLDIEDIFVKRFEELRTKILPNWVENPKPYQGFNEDKLTELAKEFSTNWGMDKGIEGGIKYTLANIEYYVIEPYMEFLKDYKELLKENPKWASEDFRLLRNRLQIIESGINTTIATAVNQLQAGMGSVSGINKLGQAMWDIKESIEGVSKASNYTYPTQPKIVGLKEVKELLEDIKDELKTIKYATGEIAYRRR